MNNSDFQQEEEQKPASAVPAAKAADPKVFSLGELVALVIRHPLASLSLLRLRHLRRLPAALSKNGLAHLSGRAITHVRCNTISGYIWPLSLIFQNTPAQVRRLELERKYPGITQPVALWNVNALQKKLARPQFQVSRKSPGVVNVLLPTLDPLLMFGGYISCLHFIRRLQESGNCVRILLCEAREFDRFAVLKKLSRAPDLQATVERCDIQILSSEGEKKQETYISPSDCFVSYSAWCSHKAHHLAQAVGRRFMFFVQEFEPIFHPFDSTYALAASAYDLPHTALFNTDILKEYFKTNGIGVFARYNDDELAGSYAVYKHALTPVSVPELAELQARRKRRLLFYARPEDHARRNLFEIGVMGLQIAVATGVFEGEWEFVGIGSLGYEGHLSLGHGRHLDCRSTLPQSDYAGALRGFDVGLSLMLAPHPSILPFEMASAGQIVVTNVFHNRSANLLRGISGNIEPCSPTPLSVSDALRAAVDRSRDGRARIAGTVFPWPRDWDSAFNDRIMAKALAMLQT